MAKSFTKASGEYFKNEKRIERVLQKHEKRMEGLRNGTLPPADWRKISYEIMYRNKTVKEMAEKYDLKTSRIRTYIRWRCRDMDRLDNIKKMRKHGKK